MKEEYMKISEMAGFFNVSVKALRLYEKKGIIKPAKVDPQTGYRYYSADQVKSLGSLIDLQSLGFSLNEIKEILSGELTSAELLSKLERKKYAWEETMAACTHKVELLNAIEENMRASEDGTDFKDLTEDERAWLLAKMICVEDVKTQAAISEAIWL